MVVIGILRNTGYELNDHPSVNRKVFFDVISLNE